jgi:hypothetical protein
MADPIWLDSDVVGNIVDGDQALEARIRGLGAPLLITPKVNEELTKGNPFQSSMKERPADRVQATREVFNRLNIQIDTAGSEDARRELFENQFKFKPGRTVVRAIEESDAITLSQVKASANARGIARPKFITSERRLANNADAKSWGVEITRFEGGGPSGGGGGGGGAGTPPGRRPGGGGADGEDDEKPNNRPRASGGPNDDPTPGFNPAGIQNVANALALFQHWASQLSMLRTAYEAWGELLERKNEIVQTQNDNPLFPVYIIIYWHVQFDNNPNMPQLYEYVGADIRSGAAGSPVALRAEGQHTYLMTIPALKTDDTKKSSGGGPRTWRDGYQSVVALLEGDHSTGGDPVAALRVINGSPMYDILPILQALKASNPPGFDKLRQAITWPSAGVNVDRLRAAFFAIDLSSNSGGDAFAYYKSACSEFNALPGDQQKDIERFLSGKAKPDGEGADKAKQSEVPEWLPGWWTVWDGNYYYYCFTDQFTVSYVNAKPASAKAPPPKTPHNKGKFILVEHGIKITWSPVDGSSTIETFTQRDWSSQTEMNGVSNKYSPLFARRMA